MVINICIIGEKVSKSSTMRILYGLCRYHSLTMLHFKSIFRPRLNAIEPLPVLSTHYSILFANQNLEQLLSLSYYP